MVSLQVLAVVPVGPPEESPAVQVSASVPGGAGGESQAVQVLAVVPGELPGRIQAMQVSANICRDYRVVFKKVKTFQVSTFLNTTLPFFCGD